MKFVHLVSQRVAMPYEIVGVIADRNCGSIEYCESNDIFTQVFNPFRDRTVEVVECIKRLNPDIVVTNISKILPSEIFSCCSATFINLHYSLLPSFGGVIGFKTLEMAKERNSRIIGSTCHLVTEEVDAGKILAQGSMPVDWSVDIMDDIERKTFRIACKTILIAILEMCGVNAIYKASDGFVYSPMLNYNDSFIDEALWKGTR